MILTKPQAEVMETFVANATRRFNVRQVSKITGQHYVVSGNYFSFSPSNVEENGKKKQNHKCQNE